MAKQIKIGVQSGDGEPPFQWTVVILQFAFEEAMSFLDNDQYACLAEQFRELASQGDPTHSDTISLDKVEDFHELRDRGGILHPHNVRVFFGVDNKERRIVVLHVIDKRNDGKTPPGARITARSRWRKYLAGAYA